MHVFDTGVTIRRRIGLLYAKLPRQRTNHGDGMCGQRTNLAEHALWFVKDAQLPEHSSAVVVDFFAFQTVMGVEGIDAAERNFNSASGRGKSAPCAQMLLAPTFKMTE